METDKLRQISLLRKKAHSTLLKNEKLNFRL